ncbi:MAG: nucleoside 2-deoxyribosyltransferase [Leptolyngbya sp. BL-A-14]
MTSGKRTEFSSRAGIIQAVDTPIGFFSLVVLAIEALLGIIALTTSEGDRTFIVRSMIALLFIVVAVVSFLAFTKPSLFRASKKEDSKVKPQPVSDDSVEYEYDVFLSSPMAAMPSDEDYINEREDVLDFMGTLRTYCQLNKIFYAGLELGSQDDFEGDEALAARVDFEAIRKSRYFILIYPARLASGVLVEAGYALALNKPSVYFVKDRSNLPYILQHLHGIDNVEIYPYSGLSDLKTIIKRSGCHIFPAP